MVERSLEEEEEEEEEEDGDGKMYKRYDANDQQPPDWNQSDNIPLTQPLPSSTIDQVDSNNCIRILLATDNHIGYAESDPIRGRDSINTFREILQLSIQHDVDMLLLAGDLFHENRPSRESLYSTMASLREYCFNSRPIRIELIGDDGIGISHGFNFPPVNYEDENLNVGLPVFSIHGNHDDPQGIGPEGALCALDILSASGLINYFGRQDLPGESRTDEEALEQGLHIQPVLLQKGRTRLALYGIGNIRDERFHYEMRSNRIRMSRPAEFRDEWFNLMLVHQNRVAHGLKNSVPENGFNDDLDLLIWGHEHDCLIQPEEVPGKSYFISQPGSSIATSLAKGESLKKHVAILEIQDRDFSMTPIPLKTVRPFVFHEIVLSEEEEEQRTLRNGLKFDQKSGVVKFLKQIVEDLIKRANEEWEEEHGDDCIEKMLPLIRLRVEYSKPNGTGMYEVGNPQRFGQEFLGKVANPKDVVQFYQKRKISTRKDKNEIDLPDEDLIGREGGETSSSQVAKVQVSTLVHQYLEAQSLGVLAENGMQRAVTLFVEKDDRDAIKEFYTKALKATQAHVNEVNEESNRSINHRRGEDEDQRMIDDGDEDELVEQLNRAKELYVEEWERNESNKNKGSKSSRNLQGGSKGRNYYGTEEEESDFGKMSEENFRDEEDEDDQSRSSSPDRRNIVKQTKGKKNNLGVNSSRSNRTVSRAKSNARNQSNNQSRDEDDENELEDEFISSVVQPSLSSKRKTNNVASTTTKKAISSRKAAETGSNSRTVRRGKANATTSPIRATTARKTTRKKANEEVDGTQTRLNFSRGGSQQSQSQSQSLRDRVPLRGVNASTKTNTTNQNRKSSKDKGAIISEDDGNDTFDED